MKPISVCVISSSRERWQALQHALGGMEGVSVGGMTEADAGAVGRIAPLHPDVVLLTGGADLASAADELMRALPECPVILLAEESDFETIRRAAMAGVRNILKWPPETKELEQNIRALHSLRAARRQDAAPRAAVRYRSQVVTVFGTKGGIGKTTIAVNLATALALTGSKVAILDLDLQFGDVGVFLDIDTRDTIAELVSESSFDADKIRSYMQLHLSGLSVLCAPKSPEYAEAVGADHVERIIAALRPHFDYLIIDTPPAFNDCTLAALEASNTVYFVLTLDISTLRNAKISMGILDSLQDREKVRVIVNREAESTISLRDTEKIIQSPVFCRIPIDWKTATMSLNKGVPIVMDSPNSKISSALRRLAQMTGSAAR